MVRLDTLLSESLQISEVSVKVCRVVHPCQSVNARCSLLLDIKEGPPQDVGADVMQERCQFLLLVPGYSSSYAGLRLCHGFPTLRPDRALQFRIPLGPIASLHQLRSGSLRFVRWLRRYYR